MNNEDEIFKNTFEAKASNKMSIKDFTFLAIVSCAALLFSSMMPLVAHVPVYGIIQIVVGLQTSLFLSLGLFKVRKTGALLFMAICSGIVQVFMAPVMFFMNIISAFILELLVFIFSRNFKKNSFRWASSVLYIPLQMPFLWIYYTLINKSLPESYIGNQAWFIALMVTLVILLCFIGTFLGNLIGRELQKAGVLDGKRKKK